MFRSDLDLVGIEDDSALPIHKLSTDNLNFPHLNVILLMSHMLTKVVEAFPLSQVPALVVTEIVFSSLHRPPQSTYPIENIEKKRGIYQSLT